MCFNRSYKFLDTFTYFLMISFYGSFNLWKSAKKPYKIIIYKD